MAILIMLLIGLAVGLGAQWFIPRRYRASLVITVLVAIAGALAFGLVGLPLGLYPRYMTVRGLTMTVVGAIFTMLVYGAVLAGSAGRRRRI